MKNLQIRSNPSPVEQCEWKSRQSVHCAMPKVFVVDAGSVVTKCGLSGNSAPRSLLQTSFSSENNGIEEETKLIERGRVLNADMFVDFLQSSKDTVGWPNLTSMTLTISPTSIPSLRRRLIQSAFEQLDLSLFLLQESPSACVFSNGNLNGCAVEIGAEHGYACVVYEGCTLRHSLRTAPFGLRDLNEQIQRSRDLSAADCELTLCCALHALCVR